MARKYLRRLTPEQLHLVKVAMSKYDLKYKDLEGRLHKSKASISRLLTGKLGINQSGAMCLFDALRRDPSLEFLANYYEQTDSSVAQQIEVNAWVKIYNIYTYKLQDAFVQADKNGKVEIISDLEKLVEKYKK